MNEFDQTDLHGADPHGADLHGADLRGVNLSEDVLAGVASDAS